MSQTFNEVTITTTKELDRNTVITLIDSGLLSVKRSGAGLSIKCLPMSEQEEKNLEIAKTKLKSQEK